MKNILGNFLGDMSIRDIIYLCIIWCLEYFLLGMEKVYGTANMKRINEIVNIYYEKKYGYKILL